MAEKTYYFVRHGASTADSGEMPLQGVNAPATIEDIPLSDAGRLEAERAADFFERLGNIEAVFSSPMERTHDTAVLIARRLGLEVQLLPEVQEVNVDGVLHFFKKRSGRSPFQLQPGDIPKDLYRAMLMGTGSIFFMIWRGLGRIPDTESPAQVRTRLERALHLLAAAPQERIVVASHGYFITFLATYILQNNPRDFARLRGRIWVPNCSVTKVAAAPGQPPRMIYFARDDYDNID